MLYVGLLQNALLTSSTELTEHYFLPRTVQQKIMLHSSCFPDGHFKSSLIILMPDPNNVHIV